MGCRDTTVLATHHDVRYDRDKEIPYTAIPVDQSTIASRMRSFIYRLKYFKINHGDIFNSRGTFAQ